MTVAIVIAFFVCWAPFHFFRFMVKAKIQLFTEIREQVFNVTGKFAIRLKLFKMAS